MSNFISKAKRNIPAPAKQVKLKLVHIDFWSAVRAGFLVTLAMGIATVVGLALLWLVFAQTGLFNSLSGLINGTATSTTPGATVDVGQTLSLPRVLSFAGTLAIVNIILGTALSGISALIFNVIGRITGGISVGFTNN